MTDPNPLSQLEVEREIWTLSRRLSMLTTAIAEAATEAARTDVDYRIAYAKALYTAEGRVADKEATALIATEDQMRTAKLADAKYRAQQEAGRNLRAQLDALRSINANVRDAVMHPTGRGG